MQCYNCGSDKVFESGNDYECHSCRAYWNKDYVPQKMNVTFPPAELAKKLLKRLGIIASLMVLLVACSTVDDGKVAVKKDHGKLVEVLAAGSTYGTVFKSPYTSYQEVNVSGQSLDWTDEDSLISSENQPIFIDFTVFYEITDSQDDLLAFMREYPTQAQNADELSKLVRRSLADGAKSATPLFTLRQMLGTQDVTDTQLQKIVDQTGIPAESFRNVPGRDLLTFVVMQMAQRNLPSGVTIVSVTATNIAPSAEYAALMEQTANEIQKQALVVEQRNTLLAEQETERQRLEGIGTNRLQEIENERAILVSELENERLRTEQALEVANRDSEVQALLAQVYQQYPEYAQVVNTQLIAESLAAGNVVFLPLGTDLTTIFSPNGGTTDITLVPETE